MAKRTVNDLDQRFGDFTGKELVLEPGLLEATDSYTADTDNIFRAVMEMRALPVGIKMVGERKVEKMKKDIARLNALCLAVLELGTTPAGSSSLTRRLFDLKGVFADSVMEWGFIDVADNGLESSQVKDATGVVRRNPTKPSWEQFVDSVVQASDFQAVARALAMTKYNFRIRSVCLDGDAWLVRKEGYIWPSIDGQNFPLLTKEDAAALVGNGALRTNFRDKKEKGHSNTLVGKDSTGKVVGHRFDVAPQRQTAVRGYTRDFSPGYIYRECPASIGESGTYTSTAFRFPVAK